MADNDRIEKPKENDPISAAMFGRIVDAIQEPLKITGSGAVVVDYDPSTGYRISLAPKQSGLVLMEITEEVPQGGKGKGRAAKWDANTEKAVPDTSAPTVVIRDTTKPGVGKGKVGEIWKCDIGISGDLELVSCGCPSSA